MRTPDLIAFNSAKPRKDEQASATAGFRLSLYSHSGFNQSSRTRTRVEPLHNRTLLGSAIKMRKPVRHFDEKSAYPPLEASLPATKAESLQRSFVTQMMR